MAIINQPPSSAVDINNPEWRNFFLAAYNVCNGVTQSGLTSERPREFLYTGRMFFDTTLGKPIFYKTIGWVDSAGVSV